MYPISKANANVTEKEEGGYKQEHMVLDLDKGALLGLETKPKSDRVKGTEEMRGEKHPKRLLQPWQLGNEWLSREDKAYEQAHHSTQLTAKGKDGDFPLNFLSGQLGVPMSKGEADEWTRQNHHLTGFDFTNDAPQEKLRDQTSLQRSDDDSEISEGTQQELKDAPVKRSVAARDNEWEVWSRYLSRLISIVFAGIVAKTNAASSPQGT